MRRESTIAREIRRSWRATWLTALVCVHASVLASGCARTSVTPLEIETGPGAVVTPDGLHLAKGGDYGAIFVKLDADFSTYDAIILEPVQIAYKRKPQRNRYPSTHSNFALTEKQTADLKRRLHEAFSEELTKGGLYTLTDQPGPRVLRLSTDLIDLIVRVPTDDRAGGEYTFTSSTGEMTLLMELRDSLSGEILARVMDRREVRKAGQGVNDLYYSNSVTNTAAVRRVFKRWAEILRLHLEEVHAIDPQEPLEEAPDESASVGRDRASRVG